MIRTFVAVELPGELRRALTVAQDEVKDRLRREGSTAAANTRVQWVRPESVHLTLKFLGDVDEALLGEIERVLRDAVESRPPFVVGVGGLGVFPDPRAPRVLWVGVTDRTGAIEALAAAVDGALEPLGFVPERKPFNAHLTLARIKEGHRDIGGALARVGALGRGEPLGELSVRTVALMRSDLQPSGAVYTRLFEVPLGAKREE